MNSIEDAQSRSVSAAAHLVHTDEPVVHQKAGKLNLKASNNYVAHRMQKFSVVNPNSQPTAALSGGSSFTDFRLVSSEPLNDMTLKLTLTASATLAGTTSPLVAENVFSIIDRVQILLENGSIVANEAYADHYKTAHALLPEDSYRAIQTAMTADTATFDASDSKNIYLNLSLSGDVLSQNNIPISALSSPVTVRVHWASGSYLAVSSELEITNASLLLSQYQYDKSIRAKIFSKFMSGPALHFRYPRNGIQKTQETITPNTPFQLKLSSIHGIITSMKVILNYQGSRREIDSLDLLSPSGETILGTRVDHKYLQMFRGKQGRIVQSLDTNDIFDVPISEMNTAAHEAEGQIPGYFVSNGNHNLSFTYVNASSTQLAMEVVVLYSSVSTMEVKGGVCSIAHS